MKTQALIEKIKQISHSAQVNESELTITCSQLIEQIELNNPPLEQIEELVEQLDCLKLEIGSQKTFIYGILDQTSFELAQKTFIDESCFSFE